MTHMHAKNRDQKVTQSRLGLGCQLEMQLVGPRFSINDSFLIVEVYRLLTVTTLT